MFRKISNSKKIFNVSLPHKENDKCNKEMFRKLTKIIC